MSAPFDMRAVWRAVFGEDLSSAKALGPNQRRVICPFHNDSTPSCDVHIEKAAFICRSCGAHGGALDVVVHAGYADSRGEAARWLREHGVTL